MKVSVIIPTYNRAYCLGRSIDSVLAQTYEDIELIVVDDGSTDNTKELLSAYMSKDKRVRYELLDSNEGVAAARNHGMAVAIGDYIAFQDSDDYWHPDKLKKQMDAIVATEADFSYTYIRYEDAGVRLCVIPPKDIPLSRMNDDILPQVLHDNIIGAPTLVMHRRCYEKIGGFDVNYPAMEDYDYAIRLAKEFKAVFVPEELLVATFSKNSVSSATTNFYVASCMLIGRYKKELLESGEFNHRVQELLNNAQKLNVTDEVVSLLEKVLQS